MHRQDGMITICSALSGARLLQLYPLFLIKPNKNLFLRFVCKFLNDLRFFGFAVFVWLQFVVYFCKKRFFAVTV